MKKNLEYFEKEYDRVNNNIESYTNRQINYMNFTLILFGGSSIYLFENQLLENYREYYPYFLFLVYGLFILEIYRTLVLQSYRKHLAEKINKELDENIINTPYLNYKLIINAKKNIFYLSYTIMWILVLIAFYIFCNLKSGFFTLNSIIQALIILSYIILYINKTIGSDKQVVELLLERDIR